MMTMRASAAAVAILEIHERNMILGAPLLCAKRRRYIAGFHAANETARFVRYE
jgi:hypothetical protein